MNLANFIVQSGLAHRAAQDYEREQAQDAYLQRLRQHGIRKMEAEEPLIDARARAEQERLQDEAEERGDRRRTRADQAAYRDTAARTANAPMGATFEEIAAEARRRGDLATATAMQKARQAWEQEGIVEVVKAALMGADGPQLENIYNARGKGRVDPGSVQIDQKTGLISFTRDGEPYTFNAARAAELLGLVKPREPKVTTVAPGGAVAVDGRITDVNTAGIAAKVEGEKQVAAYKHSLDKQLEAYKAKHGAAKATALIQNIEYLAAAGIAKDRKEAFSLLKTASEKSEADATLALASKLLQSARYFGKDGARRAFEDAAQMVRSVKTGEMGSAGGFDSPEAVREAYQAGRITREEAIRELTRFGFEE